MSTSSTRSAISSIAGVVALVWTLILGGSLAWALYIDQQETMDTAYAEARANINKDITLRRWATEHGGVYVPITDKQKSVPWLSHVPGRDITSTDGRQLTLLNPASVVRQMMDRYAQDYGIRGRITGLKYLNPGNAPDAWETAQLEAFSRGERKEVWAITDIDGQPYLRYLRAMFMEPGCEKCHAILGYKLGDMRGATGLNLPMAPYYHQIDVARRGLGLTHGAIWVFGLAGIGLSAGMARRRERELRLSKAIVDSTDDAIVSKTLDGVIESWNPSAERIFGYTASEAIGNSLRILLPADRMHEEDEILARIRKGEKVENFETVRRCKDGRLIHTAVSISPILGDKGQVIGASKIARDITATVAARDEINELAFYDRLTGLPNRRLVLDRLRQAIAANLRSRKYGALLLVDLDQFKTLNDTLGHELGDLLLQQIARRLPKCVREADTLARIGGDEFMVMLVDLSENAVEAATQAEFVGGKILATFEQTFQLVESEHRAAASIGVTLFGGGQNEEGNQAFKRAELAMYQAKEAGRSTLRFYDAQMQTVVTAHAALETDLRTAVQQNQFRLFYQAQVQDEQITGFEALVRWQHPQRGLVSPAEFIPLAEESGLILPLGSWVLQTACQQLALWGKDTAMAHLTVAVNVSARQFYQPDFVEQVLAVIERTGANPKRLKLELTESMLVSDIEGIIVKMGALKLQGVGFSLDDFGTGYSSLSYLKRLPLDQLKIDQGFVRDILVDANDAAIARMVIALAESLGLAVIAEGVETQEQREFLGGLGCHAYQGYLFSRPVPIEEIEGCAKR
jgi:diguanylate cyclase (GGDEF)-like protein/PAS domain S-box-containing protein